MQLFIGLTFRPTSLSFKKVDSFRKRFDMKYERSDLLQMTLLPPFKIDHLTMRDFEGFAENLADDLESNFIGLENPIDVDFHGFDFHTGKKNILFLKPVIPIDIFHAQEILTDSVKSSGGTFYKHKNLGKTGTNDLQTYLPIGRFDELNLMSLAVEKAQIEFGHGAFQMQSQDIVLFEKMPDRWIPRRVLYSFDTSSPYVEKSIDHFSLIKTPVNL